tara:strand:- start:693 stop:926 length:234 start_codon:yes stop_codon:yes gene_type:complete
MLGISFTFIISGYLLSRNINNSSIKGISLGGLFLILYNVIRNWTKFDNKRQVCIVGVILLGLIYTGFNNNIQRNLIL